MNIAAILTCHNRKEKTLNCLSSLLSVLSDCEVYLTDDNSTDGTIEEINNQFPAIKIIRGNGNLFWNRGMYIAWKQALVDNYDYYLLLNDDVELYPFFFEELMKCNQLGGKYCIVSGLIEDIDKKTIIYGGSDSQKRLLQLAEVLQEITFMNGNVVLVPKEIVDKIGIFDPKFHHDLGDVDYGLTAIEAGIKLFSTRRAIGVGYSNNFCRVRRWNTTIVDRLKKLYSPLGSPPKINFYFRKKHFGIINACLYWLYLHIINILPDKLVTIIWGDLYHDK
jgi:GT2 family glycosyltransferase